MRLKLQYWRGYLAGTIANAWSRCSFQYLAGYVAGRIERFRTK